MDQLKAWWAKSRWVVWIVIGVCVAIMVLVLKSLFDVKPKPGAGTDGGLMPAIPKVLQDKVDKAQEDNLTARVTAQVKADEDKKKLEEVMKVSDGAERRKRLAELLAKT
jgi:hypothetical protein